MIVSKLSKTYKNVEHVQHIQQIYEKNHDKISVEFNVLF